MEALKAEDLGRGRYRILAIPFGGQLKGGRDRDGEYFSPRTDIKADWFKERPALWHHGKDPSMGDETIGIIDEVTKSAEGWWARLWLDRGARYARTIEQMILAGKAYGSSGSIAHLVKYGAGGEILTWPYAEQTLTTMPINLLSRVVPAKAAMDDFDAAGLAVDDRIKAILADLDAVAADLPTDLSAPGEPQGDLGAGGDDAAMTRRALALGRALNLERRLNNL